MTERMTRNETWGWAQFVLTSAVVAEKGKMACLDTATSGEVTKGATSLTLRPIGYFDENLTGDGTKQVRVRLFDEVRLHWFENDTGTPVDAGDIGDQVFILDDETVTADATGASVAGRVWAVNSTNGVLVEMLGFDAD